MSAGQTSYDESWHQEMRSDSRTHYLAVDAGSPVFPFQVVGSRFIGEPGILVDSFRSRAAAEYAAAELNRGAARVDSHAVVGCKVVAS